MTARALRITATAAWLAVLLPTAASAHEGHDHDAAPPPPAASEPRFSVATEAVEVTGILRDGTLWFYVSHFDSDLPWSGLSLEVEKDGRSTRAVADRDGVYRLATGVAPPTPAQSLIITVQGDGVAELLVADLPASSGGAADRQELR